MVWHCSLQYQKHVAIFKAISHNRNECSRIIWSSLNVSHTLILSSNASNCVYYTCMSIKWSILIKNYCITSIILFSSGSIQNLQTNLNYFTNESPKVNAIDLIAIEIIRTRFRFIGSWKWQMVTLNYLFIWNTEKFGHVCIWDTVKRIKNIFTISCLRILVI